MVGLLAFALIASSMFGEMHWRMIGPFRGGRTVAISGVAEQPNVYYMAPNNGGVWKSTDYGHTWKPIFDGQDTGSIGALAVSLSDPNIVYVGSGEGLQRPDLSVGDGMYKSADAGKTWTHLGLRDGQQIASIAVDPKNADRVFVAVLGHPYGPNKERGVYRSLDGGKTFTQVLYKDENTGAVQVQFDPHDGNTLYASLWSARQAPWEVGGSFNGPTSGLFKSSDGGDSWTQVSGGLPDFSNGLGRIGLGIAPSDSKRMYALVDANAQHGGLYSSTDGGATWTRVNHEERIWGRGSDFAGVTVDPKDPETIYVANTSTYRSTDGGKNFLAIKGAPGGDDYHTVWINPHNPDNIALGLDQGATISVNHGQTWSSWYNQPTAQFYHVITDNRFPYWVYGGQQESGSAAVESRSDDGEIGFREFHPVGVEEYGYVAPDPLNPNVIYGGKATRFNWTTHDVQDVSPTVLRGKYRFVRTMPLVFSPADPHALYLGSNVIFKTVTGGNSWEVISPDLTRKTWEMPAVIAAFEGEDPEKGKHRGVVYSIAPSPRSANLIWAGTDDGLIQVTRDGGKKWSDVTPKELTAWSKVSLLEASHFDANTAYAAINRFRLDDLRPHVYRTHDGGASWKEGVNGLPENAVVNAVREDPERKGLLYAGTEIGVFVSFDDGDNWQPLQMNLPVTAVRDLVIHGDDLIVGTHGRSFWILDDVTPLRQLQSGTMEEAAHLFAPEKAIRWRWNRNPDTPLPPEEPAGENPPDGAVIDYSIKGGATLVTLEIYDAANKLVRRYASTDQAPVSEQELEHDLNVPTYWVRPFEPLPASEGLHRFVWDLHGTPPNVPEHEYQISAIYKNTPRSPAGVLVLPGTYTVKLVVGSQSYTQKLKVVMDPRVQTTAAGLNQQFQLSTAACDMMNRVAAEQAAIQSARRQIDKQQEKAPAELKEKLEELDGELAALSGGRGRRRGAGGAAAVTFAQLESQLPRVYGILQGTDNGPTSQATNAVGELKTSLDGLLKKWQQLRDSRLTTLNGELRKSGLDEIQIAAKNELDRNQISSADKDADDDDDDQP
jgi:photosystem II stability/assembly factor-like uncharacterized protein